MNNTHYVDGGHMFEEVLPMECLNGYRITDTGDNNKTKGTIKCEESGTWNNTITCEKKVCSNISTGMNMSGIQTIHRHNVSLYGDIALIQCVEGYRITGTFDNNIVSSNITCGEDGHWGQFSGCELKDCGKPDVPVHGSVDIRNGTAYNDTALFSCNTGYTLQGDTTVTCKTNNTWNHPSPSCLINDCGNLTDPSNGSVNIDNGTTYQSVAVYTCDLGYTLNGSNTTNCLANKTWSPVMPDCVINDCEAPEHLQHGTLVEINETTYLSMAVYACLPGYTFFGNNASQCLANASWSFVDANCTIKDCGEGASSANANIFYPNGLVFESTAHVSCIDGYKIKGSLGNVNDTETITCTENGTWSQDHGCVKKDCSNETHAVNADVDFVTGTLFESVANVRCILGYKINGTEGNDNITTTIQCMSTGNWSRAPVCVEKDCGTITTSYANITFGDTHYNENATVSCDKGYRVNETSGNNVMKETITCLSDGYWSNPSGCVKKDCGANISADNANISFQQTTLYTSTADVTCLQGYRLKGYSNNTATSEVIQCRDSGVWSLPSGCEKQDCEAPDHLQDGTLVEINETTYLSMAVYACLPGYTFFGNNASQCLANASWSFVDANCTIKDCGEGASSANANIFYPNGSVFESTAHASCVDGYKINGSLGNDNDTETITCTENGTWSKDHGCVKKDCSNETHAVNADVEFATGTLFESVANVSCILGYKINGTEGNDNITTTIQCMSTGNWSRIPVCIEKDCGNITTSYANITFGDTHYNENATVSCDKGYKVNGTSGNNVMKETITCLSDGYWSNPSGCVKKDCGANISADNANISFLQTTLYTSTADVTCLQGYRLKDNSNNTATSEVIQCRDSGVWSSPSGCEKQDCGGNITTQNANITFGDTHYNEHATVSCAKGYRVNWTSGENVMKELITCLSDGYWSNPSGCVEKDCGLNISVKNAENITFQNLTLYQYNATVTCMQGYRLKGKNNNNLTSEVIRCVDSGLWTSPSGCEKRDCRDPPTSNHSSRQCNSTTYESKAIFKCDSGYHTGNNTTLTCNSSGHWDTPAPNCTDMNECTGQNTCHRNADCTNNIGSYMCLCKNGYDDMATSNTYDSIGRDCQDHNECHDPKGTHCMYSRNQTQWCTNLDPGYYCRCNRGWTGTNCETNVNECTEWDKPCGHNATCTDGYGTYYCKCDRNFPQGDPYVGCFKPVMLDFEKAPEVCAHGDNEILDPINIPNGRFPYLGKYFDVFRPNLNGFLALNYPPLYERYGAENSTLWKKYVDNHIVIAPLWTNIDTRNITGAGLCVHVLSNKTADTKDMKQIEEFVRQYTNRSDFSVDVAISLTWKNATIHSPYMPGYELFKQQNLSMQAVVVTDGLYTYLLFNYDQEQFSIKPDSYTAVAAGYTYPGNFSGKILADRNTFMNLKNGSNVLPAVKGRWLHNVTDITGDMWDEVGCLKFHENQTLKNWTREQLKNSYPCPCYEQDMKEDYTFRINDSLWSNIDKYTHCYESWFFNPYDIKQRCCYRFGELRKEYPFAIGAEYKDARNAILEDGFRQCCSEANSRRYCHLYYDVNPPDDCSSWSPDDEGVVRRSVRKVMTFLGLS